MTHEEAVKRANEVRQGIATVAAGKVQDEK